MATSTTLKRAVRLIAGALTKYAEEQGWSKDDYWIYHRTNPDWDKIHVIFVSRHFEGDQEARNYATVWNFLKEHLAQDSELLKHLGLVVRSQKQVEEGGVYSITPEYHEYWTLSRR